MMMKKLTLSVKQMTAMMKSLMLRMMELRWMMMTNVNTIMMMMLVHYVFMMMHQMLTHSPCKVLPKGSGNFL